MNKDVKYKQQKEGLGKANVQRARYFKPFLEAMAEEDFCGD